MKNTHKFLEFFLSLLVFLDLRTNSIDIIICFFNEFANIVIIVLISLDIWYFLFKLFGLFNSLVNNAVVGLVVVIYNKLIRFYYFIIEVLWKTGMVMSHLQQIVADILESNNQLIILFILIWYFLMELLSHFLNIFRKVAVDLRNTCK